jgi:hypothetical protein
VSFSYDDAFPDRWLHADDLQGKPWTLTIKDAYEEDLHNPGSSKADHCYILAFAETKREYVLNKTNAYVLVQLWGRNSDDWLGHRITLGPKADAKSPTGKRIVFIGSPEIDEPLRLTLPGGEHRTVNPTKKAKAQELDDIPFGDES